MFEALVRPASPSGVLATRRIVPAVSSGPVDDAAISWGAVGTLPTPVAEDDGSDLSQTGFTIEFCNDTYRELSRETETRRASQPGNAANYVDFEITKKITFGKLQDANQIVGALATRTTAFSDFAITDTATWGTVKTAENCKATYSLDN